MHIARGRTRAGFILSRTAKILNEIRTEGEGIQSCRDGTEWTKTQKWPAIARFFVTSQSVLKQVYDDPAMTAIIALRKLSQVVLPPVRHSVMLITD